MGFSLSACLPFILSLSLSLSKYINKWYKKKRKGWTFEQSRERRNVTEKRDNDRNKISPVVLNLLSFRFAWTLGASGGLDT